jgi:hypothetical protein
MPLKTRLPKYIISEIRVQNLSRWDIVVFSRSGQSTWLSSHESQLEAEATVDQLMSEVLDRRPR